MEVLSVIAQQMLTVTQAERTQNARPSGLGPQEHPENSRELGSGPSFLLLVTSATLVVTGALLVVTMFAIRNNKLIANIVTRS